MVTSVVLSLLSSVCFNAISSRIIAELYQNLVLNELIMVKFPLKKDNKAQGFLQ